MAPTFEMSTNHRPTDNMMDDLFELVGEMLKKKTKEEEMFWACGIVVAALVEKSLGPVRCGRVVYTGFTLG